MDSSLKTQILDRYDAADKYLTDKRGKWDEYEKLFFNELNDEISALTKSKVFDPVLSTMQIERSNRVMAQLMMGKFKPMSKNDEASGKLMNLTMDRYVIPNANYQFDFLTKCRMVDLYSNIYGNFFTFIDWCVKKNGYIGPDMWLLNIRDIFPQVGAVSLEDSDFVIVRSWKSLDYFKSLVDVEGYHNMSSILAKLEKVAGEKESREPSDKSSREYQEYLEAIAAKKSGFFKVISQYERDRWVDYVPMADEDMRDQDNPHDNGELPVVCKYSIPLLDDFMGMGDSERGKSQQMALNSNWNLYMGGVAMSIFPPVKINKNAVAAMNSIKWGPAEKWLFKNNPGGQGDADVLNLTPQGISTFSNTHQNLLGSLQAQFGTSFTNVSQTTNSQMGKTPQALQMQQQREGARDSADRFYMESFLTKVMNRMANLITKKQPKALQIRLFKDEIDELFAQYPDFAAQYNEKTGQLKINKAQFNNILFDYEIVSGSTYVADKQEQTQNLAQLFGMITQNLQANPQTGEVTSPIIALLKQEGMGVKVSELVKQIVSTSGVQNSSKILPDLTNGDPENYQVDQQYQQQAQAGMQQIQQAIQQAQGGMNQIPPQPGMEQPMMQGGPIGL